jgi:hypothetical protein
MGCGVYLRLQRKTTRNLHLGNRYVAHDSNLSEELPHWSTFSVHKFTIVCLVHTNYVLGAFAKLRKRLLASSCLSVCPHGTTWLSLFGCLFNFIFEDFSKMYQGNSRYIKICQEKGSLYMKPGAHLWSYLAQFFAEWEIFQTKVVGTIKTHILCSQTGL